MTNTIRSENVLVVEGLSIAFQSNGIRVPAVRNLDLTVKRGEVMGLAGESGSGKSVTALTIAGLLSSSAKVQVRGRVAVDGESPAAATKGLPRRARKVAMIFQDPFDSLNPALTVGYQIREVFMEQRGLEKRRAWDRALEMLDKVKIPSPSTAAVQYPHQLSGGMCQRVMIAMALAARPALLIADEPTTALDVTIQAQILRLLYELHRDTGAAILLITHDLAVVAQFCQSVAIMLEGEIVEQGPTRAIFRRPLHPYTQGLLDAIPVMGLNRRLKPMAMSVDTDETSEGCGYHSRCPMKKKGCRTSRPRLEEREAGHFVRCIAGGEGTCAKS